MNDVTARKIPTAALMNLYAVVGELVISWAFVESALITVDYGDSAFN